MSTALRALACALLVTACADDVQQAASTPPKPRGVVKPVALPPEAKEPASDTAALPESEVFLKPRAEEQAQPTEADKQAEQAAAQAQAKRDLGEELKQGLTGAASCLKARTAESAPKTIEVAVTAIVMPTGSVGRSEASSGALDADEIACVRRQIESVRFALPIENAPLPVSSTLRIEQAPPPAAKPATAAPAAPTAPAPTY